MYNLKNDNKKKREAAKLTTSELKDVWLHHFGPVLVEGKEYSDQKVRNKSLFSCSLSYLTFTKVVDEDKKMMGTSYFSSDPT